MSMANPPVSLFDIPWEQVLCNHLLPCFSLKELFMLRGLCSEFRDLIDCHFSLAFKVNTSKFSIHLSSAAFGVLTGRNLCMKELVLCNAKHWLSDESLIPVLQNNPNLIKVDLSNCLHLSNASVYSIGAQCKKTKVLSLRNCVWVSGAGLISLVTNNLPLEHIDLCGCWNLNDEDIITLAMACPKLRYLLLNNIYGLTDRSLSVIARSCPRLLQLSVQGCWRLTDQGIQFIGEYCKELKALQVRECQKVTEVSLGRLRARKVRIDKPAPPAGRGQQLMIEARPRELNIQI